MPRAPPTSTLFPYTTLFRSKESRCHSGTIRTIPRGRKAEMSRQFSKTLAISQLARSEHHTAELELLVLRASPALPDDKVFVAGYNGHAWVQMDEDSGNILMQ